MDIVGNNINILSNENRKSYLDYLRITSTVSVIILHVAATKWYSTDVSTIQWQIFNFYDSIVRWCVPVFVMISGALFLSKPVSINKIYSKYISKLLVAYCFWSIICFLFMDVKTSNIIALLSNLISGAYHMWFIPFIIGLYMCIPFIKSIIDKGYIKYYLMLVIIFVFIIPFFLKILQDFGTDTFDPIVKSINSILQDMHLDILSGYIGYFLLGYFLDKFRLRKRNRIVIYILGVFGGILTVALDSFLAQKTQQPCGSYYGDLNLNVFFESISVFVLFKHMEFKANRYVILVSKYCFGVYLVHAIIIVFLDSFFGLNTLLFNAVLSVPIISGIVFFVSLGISAVLNQITFVNRYIV